jgi:hypothetical protein
MRGPGVQFLSPAFLSLRRTLMRKVLLSTIILFFIASSLCLANSVSKQYYPDGKLYWVQVYDDNGTLIGPYKKYWQNGRLREKVFYKEGHPFLTKRWSVNGKRIQ